MSKNGNVGRKYSLLLLFWGGDMYGRKPPSQSSLLFPQCYGLN
jgi:hypothetical protein